MSARPRPVTATVTKQPDFMPLMPRTADLSSGSETASLVSILDHDSYESLDLSESEAEEETKKAKHEENLRKNGSNKENEGTSYSVSFSTEAPTVSGTKSVKSTETTDDKTDSHKDEALQTGEIPWETWLIRKAKELRIRQRQEAKRLLREKREAELKALEKKSKEIKVVENVRHWQEKKRLEEQVRRSTQQQAEHAQKEIKEQEKKQIEIKATAKYEEWLQDKQERDRKQKQAERARKKEEERKKQEHKDKCEKAFEEWKRKAAHRPRSAPNSYGYISGQLTGYYDSSTSPAPSYYNPLPWQPIHVPQPKSAKPKAKTKTKKWNPQKYL